MAGASFGSKHTSSRRIVDSGGIVNNSTGDEPEKEKKKREKKSHKRDSGGARYLDTASGQVSSEPPKVVYEQPDVEDEETAKALGTIEKTPKDRRSIKNGFDPEGPKPLWMERNAAAATGGGPPPMRPQQSQLRPMPGPLPVTVSGPPITRGGMSDVTLINHTNAELKLVAIDAAGSKNKVEQVLRPKSGDGFYAPFGSILSVVNPKTGKSLMRYTVTNANTTLAVTDAVLLADGAVGSSGRWYDNRSNCIFFGAAIVLGVVALAAGAYILFNYILKKKLKAAGGGGSG